MSIAMLSMASIAASTSASMRTEGDAAAEAMASVAVDTPGEVRLAFSEEGSHEGNNSGWSPEHEWDDRENDVELLVFFEEYAMQDAHESSFHACMQASEPTGEHAGKPGEPRWHWRERRNPATLSFPTDFGLVAVRKDDAERFTSVARRCAGVRKVRQSKRFRDENEASRLDLLQAKSGAHFRRSIREGGKVHGIAGALDRLSRRLGGWFSDPNQLEQKQAFYDKLGHQEIQETLGHTGKGAKVGMFDSGIPSKSSSARDYMVNDYQMYDFTEKDIHHGQTDGVDRVGHGTMTAMMIASTMKRCPGIAPDSEMHSFRVFDHNAETVTHWYLDSLNLAMALKMDVINVSIGGNDYADEPFVEKFQEACAQGIVVMASAGNDGGIGTTLHPSNEPCVIAVGAITSDIKLADFTNKGVTIGELAYGFGRFKPDIVTFGVSVPALGTEKVGSDHFDCAQADGTSYAAPVVSGTVALLLDAAKKKNPSVNFNGGFAKQILVKTARRFPAKWGIYGQGAGMLMPIDAVKEAEVHVPQASTFPADIDLTDPYFGGHVVYNTLYAGAMPLTLNVTVVNSMHTHGHIQELPVFTAKDTGGEALDVRFTMCDRIWPYTGWLGVHVAVKAGATYTGDAEGTIEFIVESPPLPGNVKPQMSKVHMPFKARIIATPPREKRVLWDQFHSVNFPRTWIPDDISSYVSSSHVDWRGDHPYTTYSPMTDVLKENGYFVEVLTAPLTCFDAMEYGHLLIMDPEDEYHPEEKRKLTADVKERGLSLIVYADWYNTKLIKEPYFEIEMSWDVNFATGGSNAPALNDLLEDIGVRFGDEVIDRNHYKTRITAASASTSSSAQSEDIIRKPFGASITAFPVGGRVFTYEGDNGQKRSNAKPAIGHASAGVAEVGKGHVSVFTDTNVLVIPEGTPAVDRNEANLDTKILLEFLGRGSRRGAGDNASVGQTIFDAGKLVVESKKDAGDDEGTWSAVEDARRPERVTSDVLSWSLTVGKELNCGVNTPLAIQERVRSGEMKPLPKFFLPTYRFEQEEELMAIRDRDDFHAELQRTLLADIGEGGPIGEGPSGARIDKDYAAEDVDEDGSDDDDENDKDVEGAADVGKTAVDGGDHSDGHTQLGTSALNSENDVNKDGVVEAGNGSNDGEPTNASTTAADSRPSAGALAWTSDWHAASDEDEYMTDTMSESMPDSTNSFTDGPGTQSHKKHFQRPAGLGGASYGAARGQTVERDKQRFYDQLVSASEKTQREKERVIARNKSQMSFIIGDILPNQETRTLLPFGIAFVVVIFGLLTFIWCAAFYNWRRSVRRRASKRV